MTWDTSPNVKATILKLHAIGVVASFLGVMALLFSFADLNSPDEWPSRFMFVLWVVAPFVGTYILARFVGRFYYPLTMLIVFILMAGASFGIYVKALYSPGSSTDALILIFLPLYQWVAIVIVTVPAIAVSLERRSKKNDV